MEIAMLRMARWVVMVASALPLSAFAAPDPQLMALRQQVAALQVDHALNLTQQQAQAMLPLLQNAKAKVQAFQAQRQAAQPALIAGLTQAVTDLKSSGSISPATTAAVNTARPTLSTTGAGLRSTWQQAKQVLTTEQLQALSAVQLGVPSDGTTPTPKRHGFQRQFQMMHVLVSDSFISLVQARAG
jgi:hypothetical protein